jgi:hypothetical protein
MNEFIVPSIPDALVNPEKIEYTPFHRASGLMEATASSAA